MIHTKKILAIIPARGGSKGIPRKNILELGGLPLIAWTIRAAQNSKYIDKVILSSDDIEISHVARQFNCEVPFIRPAELSGDKATTTLVVLHALAEVGDSFDIIILLQPTSPFRTGQHIDQAIEQYVNSDISSLVSVSALNKSPEWLFSLKSTNKLAPLFPDFQAVTRRQDSSKAYYLNGAIYIFNKTIFTANPCFIDDNTQAYIMDEFSSIDIDTVKDFNYAQYILTYTSSGVGAL